MRRRGFLYVAFYFAVALTSARAADIAPPIVDIHFHPMLFMTPDDLARRMDAYNIRRQGAAGAIGSPQIPAIQRDRQFKNALGDRYLFAAGMVQSTVAVLQGGVAALNNPEHPAFKTALANIETGLRDGRAVAIGEIHINSSNYAPAAVRRKLPADGPYMQALWGLAAKYDVPLHIHLELESDSQQQLEQMLSIADKKVRLILAHCGSISTAAQIRALMDKYANLTCDLSFRNAPQITARAQLPYIVFDRTGIRSDWKALIEAHADRFSIGIDDVESWEAYEQVAAVIRQGLLEKLQPETARAVAYENASRWLRLPPP